MDTLAAVLQVLLGLAFLAAGTQKLPGKGQQVQEFERYGYPAAFRRFTGVWEVTAAALLLLGLAVEELAWVGAAMVVVGMLGALATHARIKDPPAKMAPAVVLAALAGLALVALAA